MKLRNFTLALTVSALLPAFAYAGDNTDPISASFERDLNREFAAQYSPDAKADADPLDVINIALRKEPDQILASFERDLYREPTAFEAVLVNGEADPLDVIFADLRGKENDQVRISFKRDLNRSPSM